MSIQQMLLGVGAVATKTYVDDIFSTFLYKGAGSTNTITNKIDLTEGGLVWVKRRDGSYKHGLYDTVRGVHKRLSTDANTEEVTDTAGITGFTATGFTTGDANDVNGNNDKYSSWTFRKAPGFFDVVTWTGNGTAGRQIAHSLASVPGCIMVKNLDDSEDWLVYHQSLGDATLDERYKALYLNRENSQDESEAFWNGTSPTSTNFTVGASSKANRNGDDYVAYIFAGGESTAATARSVDFDGSDDYLDVPSSSDFNFGTGDFTWEFWINPDVQQGYILCFNGDDGFHFVGSNQKLGYFNTTTGTSSVLYTGNGKLPIGQWSHVAACRSSGTTRIFINGTLTSAASDSHNYPTNELTIGDYSGHTGASGHRVNGKISNVRIIKGTALYTSSFEPPTEPLTNVTNTKLLCCNNSSVTGSTVSPTTITAASSPTASTDSPFDDPAGFKFGDSNKGIIKCGSYGGNTQTDGPHVYLGWEPQYLLIKNAGSSSTPWQVWDSMRGVVTGGNDEYLRPDSADSKSSFERISFTPTGFKLDANSGYVNESGKTLIYIAIRRSDGYVGKPPELGTGVFAMDTGNGSSTIPNFDSTFPVDFAFVRQTTTTDNFGTYARLTGDKFLRLNTNDDEGTYAGGKWDSNVGWGANSYWDNSNGRLSWMFKRHAGFDCISYKGDGVAGKQIPHSLSKIPEMIWIKNSDRSEPWRVYHKGLNGGTTPHNYGLKLNTDDAESAVTIWNQTAPTSTHFTINADSGVNHSGEDMRAFLFASVEKISKVGYYDGSDSSQTIQTGFTPRFLILKRVTTISGVNNPWYVLDTTRGWGSGDDKYLELQTNNTQGDFDFGAPTSTGFTLIGNNNGISKSGHKYIYYCHA